MKYTNLELQRNYIIENDKHWYMPYDGLCPNCYDNIPEQYTEEHCKTKLIRRCKSCGQSLNS